MLKISKKNLFNGLFFVIVISLTFHLLLKEQDIPLIVESIRHANIYYLLLGCLFVVLFVCSESVIIHYMMRSLQRPINMMKCVKYSFVGFFFSCITPSSTGGQPAQLYFMKKDNVDIGVATLVLLEITIAYKAILIIIGGILLTIKKPFIDAYLGEMVWLLYVGMITNIVFVAGMMLVILKPEIIKNLCKYIIRILAKLKLTKRADELIHKTEDTFYHYDKGAQFLKSNKLVMFNVFVITFIQRVALFVVTYLVYRAFGMKHFGVVEIIALQALISIAVEMLPLPGGIGASENLFLIVFKHIFGPGLVMSGMLLSRGISYYGLLIISALITVAAQYNCSKKVKGIKEKVV